ncbi:ABC transporter permease [Williamsia deligens]|uniref:ABC transporter permease n=1 Tax=Williamsia deligens TaxID=321325 RepID=A0ABW3G8D2_9NOCA|nr:ABC transporter permease [Williamsia deligens]MCP2194104.1 hypothetical protein [Williamsia deligens]
MIARAAWGVLSLVGAVLVVEASMATVGSTNLSCSKTGSTGFDEYSCSDPITTQTGVWPFVVMACALAGPSLVAGVAGRTWVSWSATAVLAAVGVWGVGQWASEWVTLILGIPLAIVGVVIAAVQWVRGRQGVAVR